MCAAASPVGLAATRGAGAGAAVGEARAEGSLACEAASPFGLAVTRGAGAGAVVGEARADGSRARRLWREGGSDSAGSLLPESRTARLPDPGEGTPSSVTRTFLENDDPSPAGDLLVGRRAERGQSTDEHVPRGIQRQSADGGGSPRPQWGPGGGTATGSVLEGLSLSPGQAASPSMPGGSPSTGQGAAPLLPGGSPSARQAVAPLQCTRGAGAGSAVGAARADGPLAREAASPFELAATRGAGAGMKGG